MYTIFTNNNAVADFFKQKSEFQCTVKWVGAPAIEVLKTARVLVRQGAALASNPLVGIHVPIKQATTKVGQPPRLSVAREKSNIINPYLTIIATQPQDAVDFQSLKALDQALNTYKKNAKLRFIAHSDDAIAHFQTLDLQSMLHALCILYQINPNTLRLE